MSSTATQLLTGRLLQPYSLDILHKKEIKLLSRISMELFCVPKPSFFRERSQLWMAL